MGALLYIWEDNSMWTGLPSNRLWSKWDVSGWIMASTKWHTENSKLPRKLLWALESFRCLIIYTSSLHFSSKPPISAQFEHHNFSLNNNFWLATLISHLGKAGSVDELHQRPNVHQKGKMHLIVAAHQQQGHVGLQCPACNSYTPQYWWIFPWKNYISGDFSLYRFCISVRWRPDVFCCSLVVECAMIHEGRPEALTESDVGLGLPCLDPLGHFEMRWHSP